MAAALFLWFMHSLHTNCPDIAEWARRWVCSGSVGLRVSIHEVGGVRKQYHLSSGGIHVAMYTDSTSSRCLYGNPHNCLKIDGVYSSDHTRRWLKENKGDWLT